MNYSTEEQKIGTFLDKSLYSRVILSEFAYGSTGLTIIHDYIDTVVNRRVYLSPSDHTDGTYTIDLQGLRNAVGGVDQINSSNVSTIVTRSGGTNWGYAPKVMLILEYTKKEET